MWKTTLFVGQIVAIVAVAAQAEPLRLTITTPNPEYVDPEPLIELDDEQMHCLAQNIYFESRNESYRGQIAVAHVTINRVTSPDFPNSVCGVTKQGPLDGSPIKRNRCQFSWYCDGKADHTPVNNTHPEQIAWNTANLVAEVVAKGHTYDITNGSTYYHADYVDPFWNNVYTKVAVVDSHLFYVHH
jgi:spore germination cell wall hydrolase CwlJ-like protein